MKLTPEQLRIKLQTANVLSIKELNESGAIIILEGNKLTVAAHGYSYVFTVKQSEKDDDRFHIISAH